MYTYVEDMNVKDLDFCIMALISSSWNAALTPLGSALVSEFLNPQADMSRNSSVIFPDSQAPSQESPAIRPQGHPEMCVNKKRNKIQE